MRRKNGLASYSVPILSYKYILPLLTSPSYIPKTIVHKKFFIYKKHDLSTESHVQKLLPCTLHPALKVCLELKSI
jgi:hypothetical protein